MRTVRLTPVLLALAVSACSEPVQPPRQVAQGDARLDIGTYIGSGTSKPDGGSNVSASPEPAVTTRGSGYLGNGARDADDSSGSVSSGPSADSLTISRGSGYVGGGF